MFNRSFSTYRMALTGFMTVILAMALSSPLAAGPYPDDAVVVKFSIDWNALAAVNNDAELIDALHRSLALEAASPLDMEVVVHMTGNVYQTRDQQPHPVGSGIMLSLEKNKPATGLLREQRFNTYTGGSESETWNRFHESFKSALLHSMNSSGAFQEDENGTVWLYVDDLVDGEKVVDTGNGNMVLEITAEMLYRDGSKFGSREPPEGYSQVLDSIQLVLVPSEPKELEQTSSAAASDTTSAAPGSSVTDGISGMYGEEMRGIKVEMKDGQYVMSNPQAPSPNYMPMTDIGDARYSVDFGGKTVELRFALDDSGQAFAVVIVQEGRETKLSRM